MSSVNNLPCEKLFLTPPRKATEPVDDIDITTININNTYIPRNRSRYNSVRIQVLVLKGHEI
jgi:hypothetical protein